MPNRAGVAGKVCPEREPPRQGRFVGGVVVARVVDSGIVQRGMLAAATVGCDATGTSPSS